MASTARTARARRRSDLGSDEADTRQRLLVAAVAACVEHGFEATTMRDIGARAQVSAPAIYNHFGSKAELLVAAGRRALEPIGADVGSRLSAEDVVRTFLSDGFADTRRMLAELHLAGQRHPEVAELLARWHRDHAARWTSGLPGADAVVAVKTFFALLLGLCQVESLGALPGSLGAVADQAVALAHALFPEEEALR